MNIRVRDIFFVAMVAREFFSKSLTSGKKIR